MNLSNNVTSFRFGWRFVSFPMFLEDYVIGTLTRAGIAQNAIIAAETGQVYHANKTRIDSGNLDINVGDYVLVYAQSQYKAKDERPARKLLQRWTRPFKSNGRDRFNLNFRLDLGSDSRAHPVFHASQIKKYHGDIHDIQRIPRISLTSDDDEIDKIIGHDQQARQRTIHMLMEGLRSRGCKF